VGRGKKGGGAEGDEWGQQGVREDLRSCREGGGRKDGERFRQAEEAKKGPERGRGGGQRGLRRGKEEGKGVEM